MSGAGLAPPRGARLLAAALVALAVVALAAAARSTPLASAGARQPNVVVVLTDDQRVSDMRVMRKTKRLIGRRGVSFRNSVATFPLCCPSRATMLTGQYAHNHGVTSNVPPRGGASVFAKVDHRTVPVALDRAGYRTGYIGKYFLGYERQAAQNPPYEPPGWDVWLGLSSPGRMFGWSQVIDGRIRTWGKRRQARHYQTDVLARQGASFIETSRRRRKPFFLTVATLAPHGERRSGDAAVNPRPAPRHRDELRHVRLPRTPAFNERDVSDKPPMVRNQPRLSREARRKLQARNRDRLRSLLAVDDLVERLVVTLRRERVLRDTIIIFTSDNGVLLGEHRLTKKNMPYSAAADVPLLVRGPRIPNGAGVGTLVGNIDLAPTIYDATGVQPRVPQDGISLFEILADPAAHRGRELVIENSKKRITALRSRDRLLIEHTRDDGPPLYELYDLEADPHELRSRHDSPAYAADRARLANRLDQLRDCAGPTGPNACR